VDRIETRSWIGLEINRDGTRLIDLVWANYFGYEYPTCARAWLRRKSSGEPDKGNFHVRFGKRGE